MWEYYRLRASAFKGIWTRTLHRRIRGKVYFLLKQFHVYNGFETGDSVEIKTKLIEFYVSDSTKNVAFRKIFDNTVHTPKEDYFGVYASASGQDNVYFPIGNKKHAVVDVNDKKMSLGTWEPEDCKFFWYGM
jgi:hypothetical protein